MGAVSVAEMLEAEAAAFDAGWTEETLLEFAGTQLGHAVGRFFPQPGIAVGYLGKGHNAGDTLVALGVLRDHYRWQVRVRRAYSIEECAPLVGIVFERHGTFEEWDPSRHQATRAAPVLLLDGLLGSGTRGGIRQPLRDLADEMNELRNHRGACIAAVDLPSGIDPDRGQVFPGAVHADVTFTIGNAKRGLLRSEATCHVGSIVRVSVPPLARDGCDPWQLVTPDQLDVGRAPRPFEFHKGNAGRVGIVAGSRNYAGAASLAALGALKAGAGLVTVHTPVDAVEHVMMRCPPEIMIRGFRSPLEALEHPADSRVIGCGIGSPLESGFAKDLLETIGKSAVPTVLDADGLNLLAHAGALSIVGEQHVLTPHPGEFRRLAPDLADLPREEAVARFVGRHPATLLLKGARTLIGRAGGPFWCIGTGTPAMATGGSGDLLSGVIGALLATADEPDRCAALGAWLCGRAAEIARWETTATEETVTPLDASTHLGAAFRDWRGLLR